MSAWHQSHTFTRLKQADFTAIRIVSTSGEHSQQLIVNSRHDLKRGVEVDFFGDLQHVKLLCRSEQQCCSIFPSIGKSTAEVVTVQLGVPAASYVRRRHLYCTFDFCE